MPQNADEHAGERQQDPERQAEGLGEQRVGIGADRVEGDVAEVEQAGEPDHDVEAPAEHHVDQDLDAEIVDPFDGRRCSPAVSDDEHRIDDDEADARTGTNQLRDSVAPRAATRLDAGRCGAARAAKARCASA